MEWQDEGALIAVRRHGESAAIIEVFTAAHGRHAGVVRGASSRKIAPILQPGAQVAVTWRARLDEHLGTFTIEPLRSRAGQVLSDRLALAALSSTCALLSVTLPEREPHEQFYARTITLLDLLGASEAWPLAYLRWERALLEEMGYGLDLERCAVTGATEDLIYVSPKSGRAVSAAGAGIWANRLLPLPPALQDASRVDRDEIRDGLRTTGHFLEQWLAPQLAAHALPEARRRFVEAYSRAD